MMITAPLSLLLSLLVQEAHQAASSLPMTQCVAGLR